MGIDRFVRFKRGNRPSKRHLVLVLEDYLGDAVNKVDADDRNRVLVWLEGRPSFPFRRMPKMRQYACASEVHTERWFEVYIAANHIDVITRQTDEYTNVVAEGFADLCARFWQGKRDLE